MIQRSGTVPSIARKEHILLYYHHITELVAKRSSVSVQFASLQHVLISPFTQENWAILLAFRTNVLYNKREEYQWVDLLYRTPVNANVERDGIVKKRKTPLAMVSVFVEDQDEALRFYIEKLGLEKRVDISYGPGMRWVTVAPKGQSKPEIALAKPLVTVQNSTYLKEVMERAAHGIAWMFDTDDCCQSYEMLRARGVAFITSPTKQLYGVEAVFADPYGNIFSLLEPSPEARSLVLEHRVGTAA